MKLLSKIMIAAAACVGAAPVVMAAEKPIKIKMVKTDLPSRNETWSYVINNKYGNTNKIKRDVQISFNPGKGDRINICTKVLEIERFSGAPKDETFCIPHNLDQVYQPGKWLAIDKHGHLSAKSEAEIALLLDPQAITITNNLSMPFYLAVSFAPNANSALSTPLKKTLKHKQTTVIKPKGKNFVKVTLYADSGRQNVKLERSFNLTNPLFNQQRALRIDGVSSDPKLYLHEQEVTAKQ